MKFCDPFFHEEIERQATLINHGPPFVNKKDRLILLHQLNSSSEFNLNKLFAVLVAQVDLRSERIKEIFCILCTDVEIEKIIVAK